MFEEADTVGCFSHFVLSLSEIRQRKLFVFGGVYPTARNKVFFNFYRFLVFATSEVINGDVGYGFGPWLVVLFHIFYTCLAVFMPNVSAQFNI